MISKKLASIDKFCVACGSCLNECRPGAITILRGITAIIDAELCLGCGKCAKICPAGAITIAAREIMQEVNYEKAEMV